MIENLMIIIRNEWVKLDLITAQHSRTVERDLNLEIKLLNNYLFPYRGKTKKYMYTV